MLKLAQWVIALALPLLTSCMASDPQGSDRPVALAAIDHVIVGVRDLDAGIREFERLSGARPVIGGVHPGRGTRNALLSLGNGVYLELYAPNPDEPVDSADVRRLNVLDGLKPFGWAVLPQDPDGLRTVMKKQGLTLASPEPGSRKRPDGVLLEWESFGYERLDHPLVPFFIRWKDSRLHPSRTSPGGCRLVSLRLVDPQPDALAKAVRPLDLDVLVEQGPRSQMILKLACANGDLVLS